MSLKVLLLLLCCIGWTTTYIDCIRIGIKDKTFAMPFYAIALNLTWEIYNTIQGYFLIGLTISTLFDGIWFLLDCAILWTYLKYGKPSKMSASKFYWSTFLIICFCLILEHLISTQFGRIQGALHIAYLINLIMSLLFIIMLKQRKSNLGQTLTIAISKGLGTFFITLLIGIIGVTRFGGPSLLLLITGSIIFCIDIYYTYLLYNVMFSSQKRTKLK